MNFILQRRNIIILLNSPELGGAEKQALTLGGYLQNNLKCNVFVYACFKREASIRFMDCFKENNLKNLYIVKSPLSASSRFKSIKIRLKLILFALKLARHRPDIIIPYLNNPSMIAAHCKKISGASVTFWNNRGHEIYRNDDLEKRAVLKTDFFTVNSLEAIQEMKTKFKVSKNRIHFMPNFLTLSLEKVQSSKPIEKDELVLGMLAHFKKGKLHNLLLESFFELSKIYPFIKLYLVGEIIDETEVSFAKKYVEVNMLNNKVFFIHGESGENIIPKFDIAVLVSDKEGMSNSIMEYMYFKKPIVCTNHSSNTYLLGEKTEFLIGNNNQELIQKLRILIESKKLRDEIGFYNYTRIIKGFSLENYILTLESIINS